MAHCKSGKGLIRINGQPLNLIKPEVLRYKIYEPILILGEDNFTSMDIRVRVAGGGHTSQIYAIRQAIAKACVAYWAKYYDAAHALSLKKSLVDYDRTLLIADPRRMEPKKFGGQGARARRQKRCGVCSFEVYRNGRYSDTVLFPATDKRSHTAPRLACYLCRYAIWRSVCSSCKIYVSMQKPFDVPFCLDKLLLGVTGYPLNVVITHSRHRCTTLCWSPGVRRDVSRSD